MGSKRFFVLVLLLGGAGFGLVGAACDSPDDESDPRPSATSVVVAATATAEPTSEPTDAPTTTVPRSTTLGRGALVVRVIDGDTIELEGGERVRYIGIDTPESTTQHECFGEEASQRNRELVGGQDCRAGEGRLGDGPLRPLAALHLAGRGADQ